MIDDSDTPLSLWQAAYLWAGLITDASDHQPVPGEDVRVLITYAITVEARHLPGLVPGSCVLLDGPAALGSVSLVALLERQLHTFLDTMLGLFMSYGVAPVPWEPGYPEFQSLLRDAARPSVESMMDGLPREWDHAVAVARDAVTTVIMRLVTDGMTDVPLALLSCPRGSG